MSGMPPVTVNVTANITEPITKLFDSIARGTGRWYEPIGVRRKANAERDAALIAAQTEVDVAMIRAEGEQGLRSLEQRAAIRVEYRESCRQANSESIVDQAADQLPGQVSPDPVDDDWLAQFFNYSQDVGNAEMQKIWASLLAGEVTQPGSVSVRTLDLVRMMRQDDASLFRKFCNYVWDGQRHFWSDSTDSILESRGIGTDALMHLGSIGLLTYDTFTVYRTAPVPQELVTHYCGIAHLFSSPGTRLLEQTLLTRSGVELAAFCQCEPDEEYRNKVVQYWAGKGIPLISTGQ